MSKCFLDNMLGWTICLKWATCSNPQKCPRDRWPFTFWTWSRCGQVRVRGGFQQGGLLALLFFTLSESSSSRKEHKPPQSTRPSSLTASLSRRRPRCSWVTTTLSNRRPYSSLEPRPTEDQAKSTNSVLDKERDVPTGSCTKINRIMRHCTMSAHRWVSLAFNHNVLQIILWLTKHFLLPLGLRF